MAPWDGFGSTVTGFSVVLSDVSQFDIIDAAVFSGEVAKPKPKQGCEQQERDTNAEWDALQNSEVLRAKKVKEYQNAKKQLECDNL